MYLLGNKKAPSIGSAVSRRQFIRMGIITAASALVPHSVLAALDESPPPDRILSFYNVNSHETIETVYYSEGRYIPEALSEINHLFRDSRTGKEHEINTDLLDLLFSLRQKLKCNDPFHIYSGYRTPRSNALLRKRRKGVAKNSLHMYGKAADIHLPGYSLRTVRKAAMSFRQGGVGYYPRSKFIHVDVGQVRYWWG